MKAQPQKNTQKTHPPYVRLAGALAKISEDLVIAGLGPVNLGQMAKHILKLKPTK